MSFPAHLPSRVRLEKSFHPTSHQVVVVCNQNAEISHGSLLKLGLGARLTNSAEEDIRRNQLYWKPIIHNKWEFKALFFPCKSRVAYKFRNVAGRTNLNRRHLANLRP